ncbi:uncharacterized protein LOC131067379 [Cryptomeria japonica]|uniref:uncharacterized protein LOC131067379 n=1 Tax=Cryptomeria japonica TaxID=3369 RepID=UPI0027D9E6D8|nr:uncharacterized protein LOC131067379 [Cryptomeria japonica]
MEDQFTFEEITLQMFSDLKTEVVTQFEYHHRLFSRCFNNLKTISTCFLQGIYPPGDGGQQIACDNPVVGKGHCLDAQEGNEVKLHLSHAFLDGCAEMEKQKERENDNGGGEDNCTIGGRTAARENLLNAHMDRWDEKREEGGGGEEENGDGGQQIAGDNPGKGHCLDVSHAFLEEQEERENDNGDGEDNSRIGGRTRTPARENLLNAHVDRWDEKREGGGGGKEENKDVNLVHKGGRRGGRWRRRVGAKEKKENSDVAAALPAVGRITLSKRRPWQMILGAEKESGKRKAMEIKEQPQATRITRARCKLQAEVEVAEEPMNVAATVSPSACPKMAVSLQTGDKDGSSPLPYPVIAVLSQTGGTGKSSLLPSPVIAVLSQTEGTGHSSPLASPVKAVPSQTGGRGGLSLFPSAVVAVASQARDRGDSEINEIYLKGDSISKLRMTKSCVENQESTLETHLNTSLPLIDAAHREEMVTVEMKSKSSEQMKTPARENLLNAHMDRWDEKREEGGGGEEENGDGGQQIAGDNPGKGHCLDAQDEGKLEKQEERENGNGDGEDNCRIGGRTPARENLLNVHIDKWDEKREGGGGGEEENEHVNVVHKGGRGGGGGRGRRRVGATEKEKKSDVAAALPAVGRITLSKRRPWQMILGAEKETGKRKAMELKEQPQATRITRARCKWQAEVEVAEEPMNVAATVSPSTCPKMAVSLQTGDKDGSSPSPYPVIAVLSQTGGTGKSSLLPSPVIVVLSQTEETGHSSPLPSPVKAVPSQTGGSRGGLSLFPYAVVAVASQARDRGDSSSEINEIYLKGESISQFRMTKSYVENQESTLESHVNTSLPLISAAHREEMVTIEIKKKSLELVCEDSNYMNCMRIPQEVTTKIFEECTGGRPSSSPVLIPKQNKDNSAAHVMIQLEVVAIRDNAGHGEEIVTIEAKLNSLDPVCEGSNDMDCKRILQKDTPKIVQECAEGWPSPRPYCGYSADMKAAEQSEALDAIEIIQLQDTSNIIEELKGNEDTETLISHDVFQQTSICSNEVFSRNLPSYTSYAKNKEGSLSCTPLPRFQADGMSSVCTSISYLLDKTHLHTTPSNAQLFGSCFEVTSPQHCGQQGDSKTEPSDDTHYTATNKIGKIFGSSVRKKDSGTPNVRAGSRFASQISPRISQRPSNISCNVKSFTPLVQQKKASASVMTGKRDIKVKALKAAGVAKRLEEKREQEKGGKGSKIACSDSNKSISSGMARKKPVGCTVQYQSGTSVIGVDLKLRRALATKNKMEQENLRKLDEKKKKEEERKKNAAEVAANKKKKEEMDKRDREEKRRRLEAQKQRKELEEQLRAKEAKEQRRRALDDCKRKRKAMEEKAKKQRRIEKEREAAERRRQIEEYAKSKKFASKDAKHMQKVHQHNETTTQAQNVYAGKVSSMLTSCAKGAHGTEGQSVLGRNPSSHLSLISNIDIESYEISHYKGSYEEDNDDRTSGKPIPLWARKEYLIRHIISQQYIDPDEIFACARTCSLNEVFESNGSNRRGDFKRRSYSGEWLNDCFTWREEYQYKLQMGYINEG